MTRIYYPEEQNIYSRNFNQFFIKKYRSFKKLFNLGKGILAQKKRIIKVRHLPYVIYIDPTNICPLKCPLCPTGIKEQGRDLGVMNFHTCKKIIDQLKDFIFFVRLYNWGEPFLNKHIFEMIDYIHRANIGLVVSTNLNSLDDEIIEKIANSPLDYLIVSIDGINQESYEKYRKGGDFEKVMCNLKKLISLRKILNNNLKIEWQFIVNRYNQKEIKEAEKLAAELEVDILNFPPIFDCLSAAKMDNKGEKAYREFYINHHSNTTSPKTCSWLYSRMVFNWDGKVSPCCALDDAKTDFGDLNKDNIKDIWNNTIYQTARKLFGGRLQEKHTNFICGRCLFMRNGN